MAKPRGVGEADGDFGDSQPFGATLSASVQSWAGSAAGGADDFDVAPTDAAKAGAQRFHYGFFGRETSRQVGRAAAAIGYFSGREYAPEETISVAVQNPGYPVNLDEIYPGAEHIEPPAELSRSVVTRDVQIAEDMGYRVGAIQDVEMDAGNAVGP